MKMLRMNIIGFLSVVLLFTSFLPIAHASDVCTILANSLSDSKPLNREAVINLLREMGKEKTETTEARVSTQATVPIRGIIVNALAKVGAINIRESSAPIVIGALQKLSDDDTVVVLREINAQQAAFISACAKRSSTTCQLSKTEDKLIKLTILLPNSQTYSSYQQIISVKSIGFAANIGKKRLSAVNQNEFILREIENTKESNASIEIEIGGTDGNANPDLRCTATLERNTERGIDQEDQEVLAKYEPIPHLQKAMTYSDLMAITPGSEFPVAIKLLAIESRFIAVKSEYKNRVYTDSLKARRRENIGVYQEFTFHWLGEGRFTLKSNGTYLSCRHDDENRIVAKAEKEDTWEIFSLITPIGSDRSIFSFKSDLKKFIGLVRGSTREQSDWNAFHCAQDTGDRFQLFRIPRVN